MPEICVNLATHNRADFLKACLVSLCEQTLSPSRYEICVVNNACTDATSEIVATVAALYPRHRMFMVYEPEAGLSRARNCGLANTEAPLVADIDDDATADPYWLECYLRRFAELPETVAAVGGEINPVWQIPPPPWLDGVMKGTLSAATNLGKEARYLQPHEGVLECNTCYRRAALASVGNFPVELGRVNNSLLSGEGSVNSVIRSKGWQFFFEPAAIINHFIHGERLTPQWLRKRFFWQGVSDYAIFLYYQRQGLKTINQMELDLPLNPSDWTFMGQENTENLGQNIRKFQCLGFALAMNGIIPISGK